MIIIIICSLFTIRWDSQVSRGDSSCERYSYLPLEKMHKNTVRRLFDVGNGGGEKYNMYSSLCVHFPYPLLLLSYSIVHIRISHFTFPTILLKSFFFFKSEHVRGFVTVRVHFKAWKIIPCVFSIFRFRNICRMSWARNDDFLSVKCRFNGPAAICKEWNESIEIPWMAAQCSAWTAHDCFEKKNREKSKLSKKTICEKNHGRLRARRWK